jgi:hypothetical protein
MNLSWQSVAHIIYCVTVTKVQEQEEEEKEEKAIMMV